MAKASPFAGLKLSDQLVPTGKLDQQLFAPSPPAATEAKPVPKPAKPESRSESTTSPVVNASLAREFDLDEEALYQANYLFTLGELESLEDLKIELRRDHDQKISKQDLQRIALHMLVEDYHANGPRSYVCRKLAKRRIK
jgi:hypothetical protein